jgi:adiponectin receptor
MPIDASHFVFGGALYIFGATLYILRIPEKLRPGKFDIVVRTNDIIFQGSSHQLFHFFIIAAAIVHYRGSMICYEQRLHFICPNA